MPQVLSAIALAIAALVVQKSTNPSPTLPLSPNYGYLIRDDRRERSRRTEAEIYRNPRLETEFDGILISFVICGQRAIAVEANIIC